MRILIIGFCFILPQMTQADPLKKVLKRKDYCSPLQKIMGSCSKGEGQSSEKKEDASQEEKKGPKKKARKGTASESEEEFLR